MNGRYVGDEKPPDGFLNRPLKYLLDPHQFEHTWRPYDSEASFPEMVAMDEGKCRNFFRALAEDESTAGWLREVWKAGTERLLSRGAAKKDPDSFWTGCLPEEHGLDRKASLEEVVGEYLAECLNDAGRTAALMAENLCLDPAYFPLTDDVESVRIAHGYSAFMEAVHRFRPLPLIRITDDESWRIRYLVTECALMRTLLDREPIPLRILSLPLRGNRRNAVHDGRISVLGEMIRGFGVLPRNMDRFLGSIPDHGLVAVILQESLAALATGTASAGQKRLAERIRGLLSSPVLADTRIYGGVSFVFENRFDTPVPFESALADLPVILPWRWSWKGFESIPAGASDEPVCLDMRFDLEADRPLAADVKRVLHARSHGELPSRSTWEKTLEIVIRTGGSMGNSTILTVAHLMAMAGYAFPGEPRILGTAPVLSPEKMKSRHCVYPDIENTVLFALLTAPLGHSWNGIPHGIAFPDKGETGRLYGNGPIVCRVLQDPGLLRMPLEAMPDVTVADVVSILARHFHIQWSPVETTNPYACARNEPLEKLQILEALSDSPESLGVPYRVTTGIGMSRETLGKGSNPIVCLGLEILAQVLGENLPDGEAERVDGIVQRFFRAAGKSGLSKSVLSFLRDRKKIRETLALRGLGPDAVDDLMAEGRAILALQTVPPADENIPEEADSFAIL
jgi:hypothetical protein